MSVTLDRRIAARCTNYLTNYHTLNSDVTASEE